MVSLRPYRHDPFLNSDLNCHFYESYITTESIKKWPRTCEIVCGNIFINDNTDLSEKELKELFRKLVTLNGNLRIENSSITSLKFLSRLNDFYCGSGETTDTEFYNKKKCIPDGFVIANNPDLSDIKHLDHWYTESECVWHIINNTKADLSKFCDYQDSNIFNSNLDAYGNLNGCGMFFGEY